MKKSGSKIVIPNQLSPESKVIWRQICRDFALENHALIILVQALEALDRLRQAQEIIDNDGPVIKDRFGVPKQHPATLLERDARNQFLRAWKQLGLDIEPPLASPGRPAGGSLDAAKGKW
jgi:P27 family predicted phage terminase small subunit